MWPVVLSLCIFFKTEIGILFYISSLFLPVLPKPHVFKVCPHVRCASNLLLPAVALYSAVSQSFSCPHCLQLPTTTNVNVLVHVPLWTWEGECSFGSHAGGEICPSGIRLLSGMLGQFSLAPAGHLSPQSFNDTWRLSAL